MDFTTYTARTLGSNQTELHTPDVANEEEHTMTTAGFNESELNTFITEVTDASLNSSALLTRFKEDVTPENLTKSTNAERGKVRDKIEENGGKCGRGSGDSIKVSLLALLNHTMDHHKY